MSQMVQICHGKFGRVAILDLTGPLTEHAHSGNHLLFWIGGDCTSMKVGKRVVPLDADHAVAVNDMEPHAVLSSGSGERCLYLLFYFNTDWVINRSLKLGVSSRFDYSSLAMTDEIRQLVRGFSERLTRDYCDLEIDKGVSDIFDASVLAMQGGTEEELKLGKRRLYSDFRIRRSVEFMYKHLDVRMGFDEVAREAGLSRPHFFYLFRKHMRMTPAVFWNTIRMEVAIEQLIMSDAPLTDLSYNLGFTEPGNFSRFFKSHSGVCPSEYRLVAGGTNRFQ